MKIDAVRKADVLHFHDTLGGYLNIGIIRQAAKEKPVVWSMRDMWAFTGHCVYAGGGRCEKWLSGCKKCPFLGEYPPILIDTASLLWKIKKNDAEACAGRVWCVSPSNWMCGLARKSLLSPLSHSVIPNCVDTRTFFPRKNRNSVRAGLGLPKNAFVLSFMAAHLSNEFKGLPFLVRALQIIKSEGLEPTVLLIGEGDFDFENAGITGEKTGFVSDENRIAELLSASDAFVAPSLVDNQPLAVLEALACGKPVIAFGAGGIPEIVRHKKTGFIAKTGNAESLAEGLAWVMGLDSDRRSKLCADSVLSAKLFSVEKNAAAYIKLYAQILKI
ncbi:MAG: glycosyltransferase [Candidatus Diapherotrites archaeon]|nr:glycosyltransferase [Candidatus Diapherotrites archaeon]